MEVLVTGGAGFIGTHTNIELLNAGFDLIVVDNFSNSKPESLYRVQEITKKNFRFYDIDILDAKRLEEIFSENNIEAVIHFAGSKNVGESMSNPLWYYKNNIISSINLCLVMQKFHVKNLVFSSSATVYGVPEKVPISEDFPLKAMNPYGRTKLIIEEMLQDLVKADPDWSISILRYFNPVGAHKSGMIGEDPKGTPSNLMPYITKVAIGDLKELQVFGNDYPTTDGTGVRDYIHVVDLAKGHVKALEKTLNSTGITAYNLGTGNGYTVLELVTAFEVFTGIKIPYQITKPRPGDVASCFANTEKAQNELGWISTKGIKEMCEDSWRWQFKNPKGYINEEKVLVHKNDPSNNS